MNYYMIGIKGAGMSSLALFLNELGNNIVGYDDNKDNTFIQKGLDEVNIPIYYDNSYKYDRDTILIYSPAFTDSHPEMTRAKELKKYSYVEFLGELTKNFKTIAVSGCHGKTTTTSLISHIMNNVIGVNYIIGDGSAHSNKSNNLFVLEACEYRRHFLNYHPEYSIITNIELDHIDYYKDLDDVRNAYSEFASQTKNKVVMYGDKDKTLDTNTEIIYYGINDDNDVQAKNVEETSSGINFDVYIEGEFYYRFNTNLYGHHMLLNALAAIIVCKLNDISPEDIEANIKTFKGANRRFSERKIGTNIIVDDYAHHPSEIKATIEAAKQKYPTKTIVGILQPHTFTRTKEFYKEFAEELNKFDHQYVTEIFNGSRENKDEFNDITNKLIIDLCDNGDSISVNTIDKLKKYDNSVIIFMSAGNIKPYIEAYEKL